MRESPILGQHFFSSILIKIKVIAQNLGVDRDFWQAHFTKRNKHLGLSLLDQWMHFNPFSRSLLL